MTPGEIKSEIERNLPEGWKISAYSEECALWPQAENNKFGFATHHGVLISTVCAGKTHYFAAALYGPLERVTAENISGLFSNFEKSTQNFFTEHLR